MYLWASGHVTHQSLMRPIPVRLIDYAIWCDVAPVGTLYNQMDESLNGRLF